MLNEIATNCFAVLRMTFFPLCHPELVSGSIKKHLCHPELVSGSIKKHLCHPELVSGSIKKHLCHPELVSGSIKKHLCHPELVSGSIKNNDKMILVFARMTYFLYVILNLFQDP